MDGEQVPEKLTQQELAKRLGVSQMTVSRVLNGQTGVGKKLRSRVLQAVQEYDYVHDYIAAGLKTNATKVIGLVIPDVSNSFFPEVTKSIKEKSMEAGYSILLAHTEESYKLECEEINLLRGFKVEGLIIAPAGGQEDTQVYERLLRQGIPFVFIDRFKSRIDCSYVVTDMKQGAIQIGEYLFGKGYSKWGYLAGPKDVSVCNDHYEGLCEVLRGHGESQERIISVDAGFYEEDGYKAACKLMEKCRPDVIVAMNDAVAIGAYRFLKSKKISVPGDVALVGFSDLKAADLLEVPLTTVREATDDIGRRAIEILLEEIADPSRKARKEKLVPKLIVRKSA